MRNRRTIVGCLMALLMSVSMWQLQAQVHVGVKGGLNISTVHFDSDLFKADNLTGFQVGPMIECQIPLVGLGFDAALLYSQKGMEVKTVGDVKKSMKSDYLSVPLNLKWKMGIPLAKLFVAAGPYVDFRIGGDKLWELPGELADQVKTRNFGAGLNFGAGVELISHLQVGFNYALGLTDNYSVETPSLSKSDGKNRGWSVTAAILF